MNNLARVLSDQGEYDAAEEMYRRALELGEKVLGPEHPYNFYAYHLCIEFVYVNCVYCQGQRQALERPVMLWIGKVYASHRRRA